MNAGRLGRVKNRKVKSTSMQFRLGQMYTGRQARGKTEGYEYSSSSVIVIQRLLWLTARFGEGPIELTGDSVEDSSRGRDIPIFMLRRRDCVQEAGSAGESSTRREKVRFSAR
jgi:hypothetical protein